MPSGSLGGRMQRDGFLRDSRRVADQIERFHQFVTGEHVLSAETIRIRTLLNFVFRQMWWPRCPRRTAS